MAPIYRSTSGSSFDYSRYSIIYTASDLTGMPSGAIISDLEFYLSSGATATGATGTLNVYLRNTTATNYTSAQTWNTTGATLVYSSTTQTITGTGFISFGTWSSNFSYTGDSIEVLVDWDISAFVGSPTTAGFSWQYSSRTGSSSDSQIAGGGSSSSFTGLSISSSANYSRLPNARFTYSLVDSVVVSGTSFSNVVAAGSTDQPVSAFTADATNTSTQDISSLTLTYTGSAAAADVTNVKMWDDANNNGQVDTGETQLGSTAATISGGQVTFTGAPLFSVTPGTTEYLLVTADIAATAASGSTASFSVNASTDVTASPGPVNGGYPADGGSATIEVPSVEVDGSSPTASGSFGVRPSNDLVVLDFTLTPVINHQTVSDITVTNAGTMADADISAVRLWLDLNNDGFVDSGDVLIGGTQQFAGGTATFSNLNLAVNLGTVRDLVVSYSFNAGASGTIGCEIASATDVTNSPDVVLSAGGFPVGGVYGPVAAATASLPYLEDFDQASVSGNVAATSTAGSYPTATAVGGSVSNSTTSGNGTVSVQGTFSGVTPNSGAQMAVYEFNTGTTASALDFLFDLSAYSAANDQIVFSLAWLDDGIDGGTFANFDHVFISNDGGQSWITSLEFLNPLGAQNVWNSVTVDVSDALNNASANYTSEMIIRVQFAESSTFEYAMIDDVELELIPPTPPNISVPSSSGSGLPEVLYYKFNEGTGTTTANDASPGQGTAAPTIPGTASWLTPGDVGAASLTLAGSGAMSTGWTTNIGTSDWTIEFRLRVNAGQFGYVCGDSGASSWRVFTAGAAGTNGITFRGGGMSNLDINGAVDGNWHHVAFVYDSTANTVTGYLDGVQAAQNTGQTLNINGSGFYVGSYTATSSPMVGDLDEFRFWSQARSASDIQSNYQAEVSLFPTLQVSGTAPNYTATVDQGGDLNVNFTATDINNDDITFTTTVTGGTLTAAQAGFDQTFTGGVYNDPNPGSPQPHTLSLTGIAQTIGNVTLQVEASDGALTSSITLDIVIQAGSPIVRADPISLSPMNAYGYGLPSAEEVFSVQGYSLGTNDLTVTAPAEFEVSLTSGSGFSSSVAITPTGGAVTPTDVYVRYNPASAGPHSGSATVTSTGANSIDVGVSGFILPQIPPVIETPESRPAPGSVPANFAPVLLTEMVNDPGPSGNEFTEITNVSDAPVDIANWSIKYLTGTTPYIDHTITGKVLQPGETYCFIDSTTTSPYVPAEYVGANISSLANNAIILADDNGNVVDVVACGTYNVAGNPDVAANWSGPNAPDIPFTNSVVRSGDSDTDSASDWSVTPGDDLNVANPDLDLPIYDTGALAVSGSNPNFSLAGYVGDEFELIFSAYDYNVQETLTFTVTVTGGSLTAAGAGFNQTFTGGVYNDPAPGRTPHSILLDGTLATTGTLDMQVDVSDGQLTSTINVTLTITNPPTLNLTGTPLNVMISPSVGTASPEQSFTIDGTFLQGDVTLTAPAEFEISTTSGSGFGPDITLTPTAGTLAATTIFVRYNPTAGPSAVGDLVISTPGVADINEMLWGVIGGNPVISTLGTPLAGFSATAIATPSFEQSFTVLVANPVGSVDVTAPADFEVSLASGTGFGSSVTINAPASGTSQLVSVIYVRYNPAGPATTSSGDISVSTSGATTVLVAVTGEVGSGGGSSSGGGGGDDGGGGCVAGTSNTGMWGVLLGALALLIIALRVRAVRE